MTTTNTIEGQRIVKYLGIVSGEAILGAHIFKDLFASIRDIIGGRAKAYEEELRKAMAFAYDEMQAEARALGGNAIIAVDLDFESIKMGRGGSMLMVTATGTAIVLDGPLPTA